MSSEGGAAARVSGRGAFATLAALLTCSGACGLVFEVLWVKYLSLAIGQTTVAVSLLVAAFLGGLVAGSLVAGRWADRVRRPLRLYAALELATGALALATTLLLRELPALASRSGLGAGPLWLRVLLAFALVLPPTFAMGGTLPAAVRFATRSLAALGRSFGTLYSLNTLGAAAGCALAGFWLVGRLGLFRTACVAAAMNVAVGLAALMLDAALSRRPETAPAEAARPAAEPLASSAARWLVLAFALAGFASISYEVLWFRVLESSLESSAYAFALLLSVYLSGLVLGGLLFAWRFARHPRPLELFVGIEALVALTGLLSLAVLGQHRILKVLASATLSAYAAMAVEAAAVLLVPTTLIGLAFPLVAQLTARHLERVGRQVGLLYSVNTLGGIAGSLLTGLALIPLAGTQRAFALACAVSMAVALLASWCGPTARRARASLLAASALLLVGLFALPRDYLVRAQVGFGDSRLLEAREGQGGTLGVLEYDRDTVCGSGLYACDERCPKFQHRQLVFGPVSYASTLMPARRYMRALAHLPMLMQEAPSDVLEICFGTGTTAGAFASHPSLRRLELADLNPDVFATARWFDPVNRAVLSDPRAHPDVDDGRHFLSSTRERFQVISLEPPPPTMPGASSLYSAEFYREARARMAPGGVLAQWIPLDQQNDVLARMLVRSVLEAFPFVQVWIPSRLHAVVLGSDHPLRIDLARWSQRWASPAVRESLGDVGYADPAELAGAFLMDTAAVRRYVQAVPAITDDRPAIEYFLSTPGGPFDVDALLDAAEDPAAYVDGAGPGELDRVAASARAHRLFIRAHALGGLGETALAREQVGEAAKLVSGPYPEFLSALEYGCLSKRPKARR